MSITGELREWVTDHYSGWKSKQAEGIAIADRIDAEHERQLDVLYRDMSDAEWVRLPKDADDVPWSIGDRDEDGNVVIELRLTSSCWFVITDSGFSYRPERKRHHHAPTVEDVLREFAYGLGVPVADSYIAASAAKLRLAEGEDA